VSGNSGLLGGTDPLAVEQPDNERQDGTDEKARRDGHWAGIQQALPTIKSIAEATGVVAKLF
jgi:hypothetical protein